MTFTRAQFAGLLANARRAGNPAAAGAITATLGKPTVAAGAVAELDTLVARFDRRWYALGGPQLVKEHRFDDRRRWRFDRCHPRARIAVEVDGGVWKQGWHNRAAGYIADCTKLNRAAALGWLVFRLTPAHLDDGETLPAILRAIRERVGG